VQFIAKEKNVLIKNKKFSLKFIGVILFVLSCNTSFAASINGIWESEGYSNIFVVTQSTITQFEVTEMSCIKSSTEQISTLPQDPSLNPFKISDNGQRLTIQFKNELKQYHYQRINKLPKQCKNGGTQANRDPVLNFDILWHTFDENYAFFDLRGVDWDAQYDIYRPQVSSTTSDEELLTIFKAMLTPLKDGHVTLFQDTTGMISGMKFLFSAYTMTENFNRIMAEYINLNPDVPLLAYWINQINRFKSIISKNYLAGDIKYDPLKIISWGKIRNRIGYLSINQMMGFSGSENLLENIQALTTTLDQVMLDLKDMDAMVVDVRLNGGGYDDLALKIVSRFIENEQSVMKFKTVWHDGFSDTQTIKIAPEGQQAFTKPVFVLISEETASAAEAFVLSMKALPNVTVIGERTNGILSDMLMKQLPNSLSFSLSNEVYTDLDGIAYEKIGVQPDIPVLFLMKSDRDSGIDTAIEKVISLTP